MEDGTFTVGFGTGGRVGVGATEVDAASDPDGATVVVAFEPLDEPQAETPRRPTAVTAETRRAFRIPQTYRGRLPFIGHSAVWQDALMTGIGLCLPQLGPHVTTEAVKRFAQRAEALGFTSLWVQDHFMYVAHPENPYGNSPDQVPPVQYESVWQPLEMLAAVATWTTKPLLGTSVLVAGNYWPVQLASRLATLDQLCDGRLLVGMAVGWSKEEHTASGTDFHTRGKRLEDFLGAMEACWGPDPVRYSGPFFEIPECKVNPKPVRRPDGSTRPPLLSGLWSKAGSARTVAMFDGWNPAGMPAGIVADIAAGMNQQREAAGRAPLSIWHRNFISFPPKPGRANPGIDGVKADIGVARAKGFDEVIVECNFWDEMTSPEAWAEVPDRLAVLLD